MDEENVVHTDNGILLALRRKSCDFDMGESIGHLVRQTRPRRTLTVLPLTLEELFLSPSFVGESFLSLLVITEPNWANWG
jgi:hypothetical protein